MHIVWFSNETEITHVLNFCVTLAKYFIYINKITQKNNLDLYQYLVYLKQKLTLEREVCINNNNTNLFEKFAIIYDEL